MKSGLDAMPLFLLDDLLSKSKLFSLPSQRNFPISFKPKVDIAKIIGKMQKRFWYCEKWVGRHASFPPRRSVKQAYDPQTFCKADAKLLHSILCRLLNIVSCSTRVHETFTKPTFYLSKSENKT